MGIVVEITNVDKQNNNITFSQNGQERSCGVVAPAKIQWAKNGKAEIGFNQEGNVNFIKSLEPKTTSQGNYGNHNQPQERKFKALNLVEVLKGVTIDKFKVAYNELSNKPNAKVNATNYLNEKTIDGKFVFDCVLFYTRFDKIPLVDQEGTEEDSGVNEDGTI